MLLVFVVVVVVVFLGGLRKKNGMGGGEEITALVPLSHKCSPENSLDFRVNYTESILSFGGSSLPYPPRLLTDNEAGTFFFFFFFLRAGIEELAFSNLPFCLTGKRNQMKNVKLRITL